MNESLDAQYARFLAAYPLQGKHGWAWVDTHSGEQTLVLLPGFMGEAETSFLYVLALATHARVISISYPPGIGRVDALCDGVNWLLDDLGIARATILGGSSGGFIAQAFLRRHPARTGALILTHTGLPDLERARTARFFLFLLHLLPFGLLTRLMQVSIYGYFPHPTPVHAFWRAHFQSVIRRQSCQGLQNRFALMDDFHRHYRFHPDDLAAWPGSILLMEMRHDHLTTPAEQTALHQLYPHARIHLFSEARHYDSVEQPEAQIQVIQDFLDSTLTKP